MARPKPALTGKRFGRWTVLHIFATSPTSETRWAVRCDCGNMDHRSTHQLTSGTSKQCMPCNHSDSRLWAKIQSEERKALRAPFINTRATLFDLLEKLMAGKIEPKEARRRVREANRTLRGKKRS